MAKYTRNGIYTFVRNEILKAYPGIYIAGDEEPIPPEGLAVRIYEVNRYAMYRYATLDAQDYQWKVAFDVNVYSNRFNDSTDEVYEVMEVAERAFKKLQFILFDCQPTERANNRVSRLTARFERMVGEADQMPEEE